MLSGNAVPVVRPSLGFAYRGDHRSASLENVRSDPPPPSGDDVTPKSSSKSAWVEPAALASFLAARRTRPLRDNTTISNGLSTRVVTAAPKTLPVPSQTPVVVLPADDDDEEEPRVAPQTVALRRGGALQGSPANRRVTATPTTPQRNSLASLNNGEGQETPPRTIALDETDEDSATVVVSRSPSPEPSNPEHATRNDSLPVQSLLPAQDATKNTPFRSRTSSGTRRVAAPATPSAAAAPTSSSQTAALRWRYADAQAFLAAKPLHTFLGNRRPPGMSDALSTSAASQPAGAHSFMDLVLAVRSKQYAASLSLSAPWMDEVKRLHARLQTLHTSLIEVQRRAKAESTRAAVDARRRERVAFLLESESSSRDRLHDSWCDGWCALFDSMQYSLQMERRRSSDASFALLLRDETLARQRIMTEQSDGFMTLLGLRWEHQEACQLSLLRMSSAPRAPLLTACDGCGNLRRQLQAVEQRHQREERALLATVVRKDAELRNAQACILAAEARIADMARLHQAPPPAPGSEGISQLLSSNRSRATSSFASSAIVTTTSTSIAAPSPTPPPPPPPLRCNLATQTEPNCVVSSNSASIDASVLQLSEALSKAAMEVSSLRSQRDRLADTVRRLMEVKQRQEPSSNSDDSAMNAIQQHGITKGSASLRMPRVTFADP